MAVKFAHWIFYPMRLQKSLVTLKFFCIICPQRPAETNAVILILIPSPFLVQLLGQGGWIHKLLSVRIKYFAAVLKEICKVHRRVLFFQMSKIYENIVVFSKSKWSVSIWREGNAEHLHLSVYTISSLMQWWAY